MDSAKELENKFAFQQNGLFRIRKDPIPAAGRAPSRAEINEHSPQSRLETEGDRSSSQSGREPGDELRWKNQHRSIALNMNEDGLRKECGSKFAFQQSGLFRNSQGPCSRCKGV
ncbi:hypothetical protein CEXT_225501 [Caerostris extrusa]|uniref:Uncharacterized protein n=1 Tax=Caerostris extrusa TaxID=172846 RepID=A0AAV4PNQ9_CAEEX|nr:hypothetical protein CEXT_225501 [Caerostris extrusa]